MVLENLDFSYNGDLSTNHLIVNAKVSGGLFQETFVADKSIIEKKVPGRTKPYFQGVEHSPLQFNLTLYFQDGFTDSDLDDVKRWLDINTYEEFYFLNNPDRRYICMMVGGSNLNHNGSGQGYITTQWRMNDAYAYSPEYLDNVLDFSNNVSGNATFTFENKGDINLAPECWISMVGSGNVSITNNSNNGEIFQFTGLADGETVYVSNEDEQIVSSIPGVYRYDNFNDTYLNMVYGVNHLVVDGTCKLQFRYRYRFK